MEKRIVPFIIVTAVALMIAVPPFLDLLRDTRTREYYSHIPLIVAISAFLLYRDRRNVFRGTASFHPWGTLLIGGGLITYFAGKFHPFSLNGQATLSVVSGLLIWWGAYLVLFGKPGSRRALFHLSFLAFALPLPIPILEGAVRALVVGTTFMTRLLFITLGVPLVQEGPIFYLPGFRIEVAQQCSGIRSSLALLITTVLAGHLFLNGVWKQSLLVLAVLPVAIVKNAVRIVTLYLLSYFIDIKIIEGGFLHKSGGFIFFGLSLFLLGLILWAREFNNEVQHLG